MGAFIIAMLIYHSTNNQKAVCLTPKPAINLHFAINLHMLLCLREDSTKPKTITNHQAEMKHKLFYSVTAAPQPLEGTVKKS